MQGDRIIVEASQLRLAEQIVARLWPSIQATAGRYAVTVSRNWRITFAWAGDNATDVDLEDYHGD